MKIKGSFSLRQGDFVASLVVSFVAEFGRSLDNTYDEVWELSSVELVVKIP